MDTTPLVPHARRLLKSAMRRYVYEAKTGSDPAFRDLVRVEEDLYSDALSLWSENLHKDSPKTMSDREAVRLVLLGALPVARESVVITLSGLGVDGHEALDRYIGGFDPEVFLPWRSH